MTASKRFDETIGFNVWTVKGADGRIWWPYGGAAIDLASCKTGAAALTLAAQDLAREAKQTAKERAANVGALGEWEIA